MAGHRPVGRLLDDRAYNSRSVRRSLVVPDGHTDGQWHRIGFVSDGLYRTLCVDGIAAAQDTQEGLKSSSNGLYIGTGSNLEPGTFWSGLSDDVRIYNRAVRP